MRDNAQRSLHRDTDHLHPSEICKADWCPRSSWYTIKGYEPAPKEFRFQTLNIFREGHDIHHKYQTWLSEAGVLWGNWQCLYCANVVEDEISLGLTHCQTCGQAEWEYREVPITNDEYRILGHADGVVVLNQEQYMIEIKSVGIGTVRVEAPAIFKKYSDKTYSLEDVWRNIKRPFGPHLRQGNLYMHCTGIHQMIVLYEWKPTQDVKEFVIRYQPELIADILENAKNLLPWLDRKAAPPRPGWAAPEHKTCKQCPQYKNCWKEDEVEAQALPHEVQPARKTRRRDPRPSDPAGRSERYRSDGDVL